MIDLHGHKEGPFKENDITIKQPLRHTRWFRSAVLIGLLLPGAVSATSSDIGTRIRGGEPVAPGEFPFIVELQARNNDRPEWTAKCTASLADPRAILTAAHCIPGAKGFPEPDTEMRLIFNRVDDQDPIVEVIVQDQFEQIIVNAEFGTMPNRDLAVIVLKAPYTKAPTVKLPQLGQRPALGEVITASGWGYTNNPDDPSMLRKVDIPVVSCASDAPTLCAGAPGIGVHSGDSGGPGFQLGPDGTVTQYGVVTGVGVNDDDLMVSGYTDLGSSEAWQAMREALVAAGLPHLIP